MIVRELITRLGFQLDRSGINNAERATERVRDRAESAARAFRNIAVSIASIATVRHLINVTDEMQNIRARLSLLPQTVGDVGEAFDEVARRASEAGVAVQAYSSLYTRVGNAAKDYIETQEDLLNITDTISKALTVGGASAQEASAVMIQFSQALGSGVLQGDEFRSMAEAAPQYLDKLSEAMGIPRQDLKKMASEGKLTSKAVIEATRTMSDFFNEKFKAIPLTVGRATTVVSNRFARMLDKMNRDSLIVTRLATAILDVFDRIESGVESLVKAFGGWNNLLRFTGILLATAFGAKAVSMLMAFRAVSWTVALPFIKIALILGSVALLLEDISVWMEGGDSLIGSLIGPWEEWESTVKGTLHAVGAVFEWLGTMIAAVAAVVAGIFTFDLNLIEAGLQGISDLIGGVVSHWGQWIYDGIFGPIVNAATAAWESIKSFGFGKSGAFGSSGESQNIYAGVGMGGTGLANPLAGSVTMAQMAGPAMGQGAPSISNQTQVTVTVPPGTTAEQAAFLESAAQKSFRKESDANLARSLAVYAP